MKNFIRIQSTKTIEITPGLDAINLTNRDAKALNTLNVKCAWANLTVLIREGAHYYPSEIKNWNSVKDLAKDGIFTVGEEVDTCPNQDEVMKEKLRLQREVTKYDKLREGATKVTKEDKESFNTSGTISF